MITGVKVFLSHSSDDKDLARRLGRDLRAANVDVWLDQWEIAVGEKYTPIIEKGVDEADFVLVLLTSSSVAKKWVDREWRRKFETEAQTRNFAIVPVRGEPCEIPDFLAQRSHADISGGSYLLGFWHLLEILRHYSDDKVIPTPKTQVEGAIFSPAMIPAVTPITVEVGKNLIPAFEPNSGGTNIVLDKLIPQLRDNLQAELGFPFPGIRIIGNETDMPPDSALILIEEIPETMFEVDPENIGKSLCCALQNTMRREASSFLDIDVTKYLVDSLTDTVPELVAATVPNSISWFELTDVLQRLVEENISIVEIQRILKALSGRDPALRDTVLLTELARSALSKQITGKFIRNDVLPVLRLDSEIENLFSNGIQHTTTGSYLSLEPEQTEGFLAALRKQMNTLGDDATGVSILTQTEIRRYIRKLVELEFPTLQVISHQEIETGTDIQVVAWIHLKSAEHYPPVTGQGGGPV